MKTQNDIQVSANFKLSELQCPCSACDGGSPSPAFVEKLQALRDLSGLPLVIDSAVRCAEHNAAVGGKPDSQHLFGRAADVHFRNGDEMFKILQTAFRVGFQGIGVAKSYIHVDVRSTGEVGWTYYP